MQTKEFHLGDVLSITTGRLVSPRHMGGVYDILNFMTGDNLFTHQLPRACDECKPYLVEQFPQLVTDEMDSAISELDNALKSRADDVDAEDAVNDWLEKQVAKYGELFAVKPVPTGAHETKDPIAEAVEIMGDQEKVLVARI